MAKYKIHFRKPSGKEGDLCFYSRLGFDTYRSGCKHDCLYCYSRSQNKHQYKNWKIDNPSTLDTTWLKKQFFDAFESKKTPTKVTSILRQRIPLRIGMNSDPFNPHEIEHRVTYKTLKIFQEYQYPYIILTKSDIVADDHYLPLYKETPAYFQMTVTTLSHHYASISNRQRTTGVNPWVNAQIKNLICSLFKCHGREPVGIYCQYTTSTVLVEPFIVTFPSLLMFCKFVIPFCVYVLTCAFMSCQCPSHISFVARIRRCEMRHI